MGKTIIILGDGMADEPIAALGGKTPLQVAHTPYMDRLADKGRSGLLDTIPHGYESGSEIANLSILGYDVSQVFEGRATLEAAAMQVPIAEGELAMRCNLITVTEGKIMNHSAGHISTDEARELISYLNNNLECDNIELFVGTAYRHLLKMKGGNKHLQCIGPHNVLGQSVADVLVRGMGAESEYTALKINDIILQSQLLLANHPVNIKRVNEDKPPANSIWLWSPGYCPQMPTLHDMYGVRGSVISAVDLIKGIGVYAGLDIIEVEGANGLHSTNYEAKAEAAIKALQHDDLVYLHVEASDEASHEGDYMLKIKTIEYLDARIVKPIYEYVLSADDPISIVVLPDHPTLCSTCMHSASPVPFVVYSSVIESDDVTCYDEQSVTEGGYGLVLAKDFLNLIL